MQPHKGWAGEERALGFIAAAVCRVDECREGRCWQSCVKCGIFPWWPESHRRAKSGISGVQLQREVLSDLRTPHGSRGAQNRDTFFSEKNA